MNGKRGDCMQKTMNRLAVCIACIALFCSSSAVIAYAAGGELSRFASPRFYIPVLAAIALLGLGLMLLIAHRRFHRQSR